MLSQSTGYAITALGIIAMGGQKPVLIKDVAKLGNIPLPYLGKIIHSLARKKLVKTQRGFGGGVSLLVAASKLSLYDICEALDEPSIEHRCFLTVSECSDIRDCPCHCFWQEHRSKLIDFLKETTIDYFAAFELQEIAKSKKGQSKIPGKTINSKGKVPAVRISKR